MTGRPCVEATPEERDELRALAHSSDREDADRARALLLSLAGGSSFRIAEAFAVKADSVRHWRWMFGRKRVAGLRARKAPGPAPVKATAGVETIVSKDVSERARWTLPRLQKAIAAPTGVWISTSRLS